MLAEAKIEAQPCADLPCLITELQNGAGFAVVTEEALQGADLEVFRPSSSISPNGRTFSLFF